MKVLDATFLIDYLDGVHATEAYLEAHASERFVFPAPAYAEVLVGEGTGPAPGDIDGLRRDLEWGEVYGVDERTAVTAGEIAAEMGPDGPFLTRMDALVAAVGRELSAAVVTADRDLTDAATRRVVEVDEYR